MTQTLPWLQIFVAAIVLLGVLYKVFKWIYRTNEAVDYYHEVLKSLPDIIVDKLKNLLNEEKALAKDASPLSLTDLGNQVLQETGMKSHIDNNQTKIEKEFDPKLSNYDLQAKIFEHFIYKEKYPSEVIDNIKNAAYKMSCSEYSVKELAGIYFRDHYFQKHNKKVA